MKMSDAHRSHRQHQNSPRSTPLPEKVKFIPDNFHSVDQVVNALRESGLESSNLILGIDFTKSNEWTGRYSFKRKSLHATGGIPNPYEQAISIIGHTLSPFDEDNLIPCFGFGDASTRDHSVFSFFPDHRPCRGFEEALARYREIVPHLSLSGPTSFAPLIRASISVVDKSNWQYHVLVIIADGQVGISNVSKEQPSPHEQETINAIVEASHYPLSIVMVGVGDGPWEAMQHFDDSIPQREFDNFQFVNFTSIMSENMEMPKREAAFALAALMEIPFQYRAAQDLQQRRAHRKILLQPNILPPPVDTYVTSTSSILSNSSGSSQSRNSVTAIEKLCPSCTKKPKDMAFGCGHSTCKDCGATLSRCPTCQAPITTRVRLYG